MEHPPLASLCNGYLKALNDLTDCAPYSIIRNIINHFYKSFEEMTNILRTEYEQCKNDEQKKALETLVRVFCDDLYPYICTVLDKIFERNQLLAPDKIRTIMGDLYIELDKIEFGEENDDNKEAKPELETPNKEEVKKQPPDEGENRTVDTEGEAELQTETP
eukprot:UN32738